MGEELDFTMGLEAKPTTTNMANNDKRLMMRAYGQEPCKRCGELLPHSIHMIVRNPLTGEEHRVAKR